ncbi:hypothetical protein M565_ctg1P1180 [Vibrio cyclitrophicus FF75]|nr:hypothetical protein M565_ctg1P1180 [Vibrio cyclitrophicus FF75]
MFARAMKLATVTSMAMTNTSNVLIPISSIMQVPMIALFTACQSIKC